MDNLDEQPIVASSQQQLHHGWVTRGKQWAHRHPYWTPIIFGGFVILLIAGAATAYALTAKPTATVQSHTTGTKKTPVKTVVYYSPLTGSQVSSEADTKQAVTGIMIENSPDARPQSGLKQAGIVYEAIAEGGITRFLALYQEAKPQLIGPVRSLRMYYLDWATPYQASITHFGGSAASLAQVKNASYRNLDLMADGYYWRTTDRVAPHNVYTSFEKLDTLNQSKGYTTSTFTAWLRQDGVPAKTQNATAIDVAVSGPLYNSHYDYDAASNTYLRSVDGEASNDREEGRIAPHVVIAMDVDMTTVLQDGYREDIATSGAGSATIFQNGTATSATWRKNSQTDPLQFIDTNGNEISLNRGQTWIIAVPKTSGGVTWR